MYCCVPFCKSDKRKDKSLSMHEFPCDSTLCDKWLKSISRKDFVPNDKSPSSVVCSKHFKTEDYVPNLKIRRLVKGAVPTVFDQYPAYMIPNVKIERKQLSSKHDLDAVNWDFQSSTSQSTEEAVLVTGSCDQGTQTQTTYLEINQNYKMLRKVKRHLANKNKRISKLMEKVSHLNKQVNYFKKNEYFTNLEKMIVMEGEGLASRHDSFILSQIKNYNLKTPRYSDSIIRECALFSSVSPKGYKMVRDRKLLILPSKMTLNRYIHSVSGNIGVTDLIKSRLVEELKDVKPEPSSLVPLDNSLVIQIS